MAFDTLSTARAVILGTETQFSGTVNPTNPFDYYRIHVEGRSSLRVSLTGLSGNANLEIVRDFNRNGAIDSSEILHRSTNGGALSEVLSPILEAGTYFVRASATTETTNYQLSILAFSNRSNELVWRNTRTGENGLWSMNGNSVVSTRLFMGASDLNWQISGTGDFNQDGHTDLVWRNTRTGENGLWFMNGASVLSATLFMGVSDLNWQISGTGDFNQDGHTDLVWRNTRTGENGLWFMNGASFLSATQFMSVPDLNWQIVGTGDFGSSSFVTDGRPDLVWRNTRTGENGLWFMNGASFLSATTFTGVPDLSWRLVGTRKHFNEPPTSTFDIGGSDRARAFNVGTLNSTGSFSDRLGMLDTDDFYQFNLTETSTITLELMEATASIQLLDANGNILQTSGSNRFIGARLNSGTYFVRVFQPISPDVTYSLALSGMPTPIHRYDFVYYYNGRDSTADYYTGSVIALANTYGINQFYDFSSANNETGNNGRYYITGSRVEGTTADLGKVFVNTYYDVDSSGTSFTPNKFLQATHAGSNYLGSETDTIGLAGNNFDSFGGDQTEADGMFLYHFRYYFNATTSGVQDYYDGFVVARAGTYTVGTFFDAKNQVNEIGANGRYFISNYQVYTDVNARSQLGRVFLNSYYNSENNTSYTPDGSGSNFLGSEVGWLRTTRMDEERFGEDFFEADIRSISSVSVANSLRQGMPAVITWNDTISENVKIDLFKGGLFHSTIVASTLSDGSHDWTPLNLVIASDYQIRIASVLDGTLFATSNLFALTSPGTVRVTNPNGGNLLRPGSSLTLTWTDDISENVSIELYKGNTLHITIATSTASDGTHSWTLPSFITNGTDFRIRIASVLNPLAFDWSDAFFTIQDWGDPGNTLSSAEFQSLATFSRSQQVSAGDRDDFYRFNISQSGIFTTNLTGLSGDADVQLIQDINNNGVVDSGEILAWQWERYTNSESIRRFLNAGTYFLRVLSYRDQTANYSLSTNFTAATSDDRRFAIQVNFVTGSEFLSNAMRNAVMNAASFWQNVISHSSSNRNHTLTIDVGGQVQEWGERRVLASAGYRLQDQNTQLPVTGAATINTHPDAVTALSSDLDYFTRVMIHEFGHVLGLGTLWTALINKTTSLYNANTYAGWAYGDLLGRYEQVAIPLTFGVGIGSDHSHWREEIFDHEVMTHQADQNWFGGANMPLSQLTIASLRDIGWNVNYGAAEAYILPSPVLQASTSPTSSSSEFASLCGCANHLAATGLNTIGASNLSNMLGIPETA